MRHATNDAILCSDPIVQILLRGDAETTSEAEEKYLNANIREVMQLVESPLSDEEFRAHPLIALLLSHGSRDWEDSLL
ncbi:MAG: hypothetical protein L0228_19025 [Planctomycetes bacterium]|nr:hypothetical protein [Planctomycetota bacterium]